MPKGIHDSDRRNKRTKDQRLCQQAEMVQLLREGWSRSRIAQKFGISESMVCKDWKIVVKRLAFDTNCDTHVLRGLKLAELENVKFEAWEAWKRSKGGDVAREMADKVIALLNEDGVNIEELLQEPLQISVSSRVNLDCLRIILDVIKQERELLGVNPPKQVDVKGRIDTLSVWAAFSQGLPPGEVPDEVEQEIEGLIESTEMTNTNAQKQLNPEECETSEPPILPTHPSQEACGDPQKLNGEQNHDAGESETDE